MIARSFRIPKILPVEGEILRQAVELREGHPLRGHAEVGVLEALGQPGEFDPGEQILQRKMVVELVDLRLPLAGRDRRQLEIQAHLVEAPDPTVRHGLHRVGEGILYEERAQERVGGDGADTAQEGLREVAPVHSSI
jgi:hypothetical protein